MAKKGEKGAGSKDPSGAEVKVNVGVFSISLPADLEQEASPGTLAELQKGFYQDLLSIAAVPTRFVSELMQGLVRIVRVVTFGGGRRREMKMADAVREATGKRLSRTETLVNLEAVLEKHGGLIVEGDDGRPVILLGELAKKALASLEDEGKALPGVAGEGEQEAEAVVQSPSKVSDD